MDKEIEKQESELLQNFKNIQASNKLACKCGHFGSVHDIGNLEKCFMPGAKCSCQKFVPNTAKRDV